MHDSDGLPLASILDCVVCGQIDALETAYSKYGWPGEDHSMTPAVHHLVPAEVLDGRNENHHVKRCSLCGTLYRYDSSYEYLVNGSEDTETLLRLAPADARQLLSDEEYNRRMQAASDYLRHSDVRLRRYGGACWLAHHLRAGDLMAVQAFLLNADPDAGSGAAVYLMNLIDDYSELVVLRGISALNAVLRSVVAALKSSPPGDPRYEYGMMVGYLHAQIFPGSPTG